MEVLYLGQDDSPEKQLPMVFTAEDWLTAMKESGMKALT